MLWLTAYRKASKSSKNLQGRLSDRWYWLLRHSLREPGVKRAYESGTVPGDHLPGAFGSGLPQ